MNITSESFPTDGSNTSNQFVLNGTIVGNFHEIFSAMNIMTILLSVPTNSYVIWLIMRGTGNGLAAEFFSLNLSICEVLLCLNNMFYVLPDVNLIIIAFSAQGLPMTGRSLFQWLICVECYLAVVHPVTFLKYRPLRYRVICSVTVWIAIFASCWVVALFFYFEVILLFFCFTIAQLIIFLFIQLFCCLAVLRALKRSGPGVRGREREDENHMKKRAFNIILIITVNSVVLYAPIIIAYFFLLALADNYEIFLVVAGYSFTLSGLVQPFLFLHRVRKFPFTVCQKL